MPTGADPRVRAERALDAANFFLADVRDGLGPYLAVYLLTEQHWGEARIGIVMSVATMAGILAQTPAGALVDATRAKRLVMVAAAIAVTAASLLLPLFPDFWPVAVSQGIAHAAGVIFPPAIAAISLGVVGHRAFTRRVGRNLAALAILPIRGALYTLSDNAAWLVGVQLLDGIGAGIFGAIYPVIVADLMRNTGRFNVAQGVIITALGIGAALSTALAGLVVVKAGYSAAFLTLGAIAAMGFIVFLLAFPGGTPAPADSRQRPPLAAE